MNSSARGNFMNDGTNVVDCIEEQEEERERPMNVQYW